MRRLVSPLLATCLFTMVVVAWLPPAARAAAPSLVLEPDRGSCAAPNPVITVRGANFPTGQTLILLARRVGSDNAYEIGRRPIVAADGTFVADVRLMGCDASLPHGTQFRISAQSAGQGRGDEGPELASATFTVSSSLAGPRCFAETGQCIQGRFLAYWEANGGLMRHGYPLTGEFRQTLEDGNEYTVQYFERVRLEYHPENAPPYDVLLGQFGRRLHPADPPVPPKDGATYFAETGHNVSADFLAYWQANGGLMQFGYPLSEEFEERLEDGNTYTVQYFERARFERHPENPPPYDILLGHFGRRILAEVDAGSRWQPAGVMTVTRAQHSATRLADGRVLVAGGNSSDGITATAELYDPQTGAWSATGAMAVPRADHVALLLPEGQVFVFGGFNYSVDNTTTSVSGAERYDPATGTWRPTAPPPLALGLSVATLLGDGRVLVAGQPPVGAGPDARDINALVYDPRTDRWTTVGKVDLPSIHTATTLLDGRVLLTGAMGEVNDGTTPALLYEPTTGRWTAVPLPDARGGYTATRLPDGTALVAGGVSWRQGADGVNQTTFLETTLLFDPASGRWAAGPALGTARTGHIATLLAHGRLLVVGGDNPTGGARATTAEIYEPPAGRWSPAGSLGTARTRFALAALADGRALVAGGDSGFVRSNWLSSAELFTPGARPPAPALVGR